MHFANNAEELEWVEQSLDRLPNLNADLAARIPEVGRHDPEQVRRLFLKHQDRIFFATDFQVYNRLILGSSGNEPPPTDEEAQTFFEKEWRWLETKDKNFAHMTPIQGDWTISGIGLPAAVLRKIYFDNARRLLARSLPLPTVKAARIEQDFALTGGLNHPAWQQTQPARVDYSSINYVARPELATTVRVLWSDKFLYLGYACPFTKLTTFEPAELDRERIGLWDRDVVEAFINADATNLRRYTEYELSPNGEKLDLRLPEKDFAWSSQFETRVRTDERAKMWTAEMKIPLTSLGELKPAAGTKWRINFYRHDTANQAFLAWSPVLTGSFHTPDKFGVLEFGD